MHVSICFRFYVVLFLCEDFVHTLCSRHSSDFFFVAFHGCCCRFALFQGFFTVIRCDVYIFFSVLVFSSFICDFIAIAIHDVDNTIQCEEPQNITHTVVHNLCWIDIFIFLTFSYRMIRFFYRMIFLRCFFFFFSFFWMTQTIHVDSCFFHRNFVHFRLFR